MQDLLKTYVPIALEDMKSLRLMNRMDTKFVTTRGKLFRLLELARPYYSIQQVDGKRVASYYTLYFDTPELSMFRCHVSGRANRQKLRIRSYMDNHLSYLEVKTKDNHGRTCKQRTEMSDFDATRPLPTICFTEDDETCKAYVPFLRSYLRYDPQTLHQLIENQFDRITLVNHAKTERVTIDTHLCFHHLLNDRRRQLDDYVIIEIKRDGLQPSSMTELLRQLRIKPLGFSKYCIGLIITDPSLRYNLFKPRIHQLERLCPGTRLIPFPPSMTPKPTEYTS